MRMLGTNPYGKPDGTPISGKEPEFWAWMEEQRKKSLSELSREERDEKEKADNRLAKRMDS